MRPTDVEPGRGEPASERSGEFRDPRVDVSESAVEAAVRETAEEAGLRVRITGLDGLFSDPAHVVEGAMGDEAAWFEPAVVEAVTLEPGARRWIHHALAGASEPHLE